MKGSKQYKHQLLPPPPNQLNYSSIICLYKENMLSDQPKTFVMLK